MKSKDYLCIIVSVIKRMSEPYYQGVAAELAFFFLMSLVPAAIILGELLGVFSLSIGVINDLLGQYVSPEIESTLSNLLVYKQSGTISAVFIILALWAASKAQFSMMRITNYSFTGNASGKGFIRERLRAIKTVLITIFTLAFSLLILVYGEIIVDIIGAYAKSILGLPFTFDSIWFILRWPVAMGLYFLMISYNYYVLPSEKVSFKTILPGSILASAGVLLATWVYSYYTSVFANYDLLYGSLAAIVSLLFWFYILGYVLVIGIQVNVVWSQMKNANT